VQHFFFVAGPAAWNEHVNETSDQMGGVLNLVITSANEQVRGLQMQPPTISDHAYIQCWLPRLHSQPILAIRKAGDPLSVECLLTHFVAPSCRLRHRHLMPN